MKRYFLELLSATERQTFDDVTAFVGEDPSGSFGILAGHIRTITPLVFGLARFRRDSDDWQYLALPGGLLYFCEDQLHIYSRRFLLHRDYGRISALLQQQLLVEEAQLAETRASLERMEQSMLRRLWEVGNK